MGLPELVPGAGLTWQVPPHIVGVFLVLGVGLYFTALRLCRRGVIPLTEAEVSSLRGRLPGALSPRVDAVGGPSRSQPRPGPTNCRAQETESSTGLDADARGFCAASLRAATDGSVFGADAAPGGREPWLGGMGGTPLRATKTIIPC